MKHLQTFESFLNEAAGSKEAFKYVASKYKDDRVNSVTFDEVLVPLANHLDDYEDRQMGDLEYTKETFTAFKKLVDLMVADHIKSDKYFNENLNEAKKEKFLLYTNPNNTTSRAYVAIGSEKVKDVVSGARQYAGSYQILYGPVKGDNADLQKAISMFSDYNFGDAVIREGKTVSEKSSGIMVDGKPVNYDSIELEDVKNWDRPDFADAYASYAEFENGKELTDKQLEELTDEHPDVINQIANEQ